MHGGVRIGTQCCSLKSIPSLSSWCTPQRVAEMEVEGQEGEREVVRMVGSHGDRRGMQARL